MRMEELPHDSWFYSHEGERLGPVSLMELRAKALKGQLDPRLDLVWVQGMADWKSAGEIQGLFERRAATSPDEAFSPDAGPYPTSRQDAAADMMGREVEWRGVGRLGYFIAVLLFPMLWGFGLGLAVTVFQDQIEEPLVQAVILGAALVIPLIVSIVFVFKRLMNLGMSRWWFIGYLVPLLNLWVVYRCFACPPGYAFHKKLDAIGIFLAVLYWMSILLMIASIGYLLLGAGSAEFEEMLRETIQKAESAGS